MAKFESKYRLLERRVDHHHSCLEMAKMERTKFKKLVRKLMIRKDEGVPKGCFPVDIVGEDSSEPITYIVSIEFLNCKCFKELLDEYEDEIMMHANCRMTLPCTIQEFEVALYKDRIRSRLMKRD